MGGRGRGGEWEEKEGNEYLKGKGIGEKRRESEMEKKGERN